MRCSHLATLNWKHCTMRSRKSNYINFLIITILGFSLLVCLMVYQMSACRENHENEDVFLNGFRLSDLKNMPPLENLVTDDRNTLQFPMATFTNSASLGEMLFELSALFGISRKLRRVPILNQLKDEGIDVRWNLEIRRDFPLFAEQFEGIDVELSDAFSLNFNNRRCCQFEDTQILHSVIQQHLLLNGAYFQSFKYFDTHKPEIRQFLTPATDSFIRAEMIIPDEFRRDFIICTHTMNGKTGISQFSDQIFTRAATDFLVERYKSLGKSVTVAVLGNDPIWAHSVFYDKIGKSKVPPERDVIMTSRNSPNYTTILTLGSSSVDDFAFSRKFCDVVLLSAPTSASGWWMAYLAKDGAEVFYRDPQEVGDQISMQMVKSDYYPHQWQELTTLQIMKYTKLIKQKIRENEET